MTDETSLQTDIYSRIKDKIVADLERGNLSWRMPWSSKHLAEHIIRPLRWNDVPYTGINTLVLWTTAVEKGYALPYWMTFKQATNMKANVRKGEKGTQIVYADRFTKEEEDAHGNTKTSKIPFLKCYTVFNATQIEGLPPAYYKLPEPATINPQQRIQELETFFAQTKADIYTGMQASYAVTSDRIQMPPFESFEDATSYYAVLAHELTHNAERKIMPHRKGLEVIQAGFRCTHTA